MVVMKKQYKYLNKPEVFVEGLLKYVWPLLPPGITGLKGVLEIF